LEIKRLQQLIDENVDAEITIITDDESVLDDISGVIAKHPQIKIVTLPERSKQKISKIFTDGNYKKMFGMYPSSKSMGQSVGYIREGVIPIVSSLPDEEAEYIENISDLFGEVLEPIKVREEGPEL